MPSYQEQLKINEQLKVAQGLIDSINDSYDKMAVRQKPILNMTKEFTDGIEKVAKGRAKAGYYQKYEKQATEEVLGFYDDIADNLDDFLSGKKELAITDAYIENLESRSAKHLQDAARGARAMGKALNDPSTGKIFDLIDDGADRLEDMINNLPGGQFLAKQFNLGGAEGKISQMAGELKGDFLRSVKNGGRGMTGILKSTKFLKLGFAGLAVAAAGFALEVNKAQRDLGTSFAQTSKILATSKAVAAANKANGMTQEDTLNIIKGIASEFGSFSEATVGATLQASNLVANFGLSADSVGQLARNMQAVGEGSLESALNSIELQANMARAADVPVAEVMNDVAKNTELFGKFAKGGGANITAAAIAAKKLGLELANVASIADSLLSFEDSIAKQMEAEVLLGKELNLEKAREMVFNNDIAGAMEEISRLVSADEFEAMDAVRRQALAAAVGLDAATLGRAISGAGAGGGGVTTAMRTGGAVVGGGRATDSEQTKVIGEKLDNLTLAVQRQGTP